MAVFGLGSFAMNDVMNRMHEEAGAMLLRGGFPQIVIDCVQHHVAAKRYLCAVDGGYHARLSDTSKHSLDLPGEPMDDAECKAFETAPAFEKLFWCGVVILGQG
jgi:predicted HD phosphohydrolase